MLVNMANLAWVAIIGVGLVALPALAAILLRWAGCPGSNMLGGIVAGVLIGPNLTGALFPRTYEQLFTGATRQREVVELARGRAGAEALVAERAGLSAEQT